MSAKKKGQRGWMSDKEARAKVARAERRDAFRQGRRGRITAAEAGRRIEAADRRASGGGFLRRLFG